MTRRLMITVDGFGESAEVNRAIIDLLNGFHATSVGISPVAPRAEDVKSLANAPGGRQLHFCLTSPPDQAWRPLSDHLSLQDSSGMLPSDGQRTTFQPRPADLRNELAAQWRWLADRGVRCDAISTHRALGAPQWDGNLLAQILDFAADQSASFRLSGRAVDDVGLPKFMPMPSESVELATSFGVPIADFVLTPMAHLANSYADFLNFALTLLASVPNGFNAEFHLHVDPAGSAAKAWALDLLKDPIFKDATSRFILVNAW